MKPSPFDYVRPTTLAEAISRLADPQGGAVALAGGQSLMPLLALRLAPAELLVDVGRLADLATCDETADRARLGAGITHAMIEDGKTPDPGNGLMRRVASHIAYRAVRNHGTIGGSLALADPAADWPTVLLALDTTLNIIGPGGGRSENIDAFLHGAYTTSLQPGELITCLDIPKVGAGARTGYAKVVRKSGAFANAICCVVRYGDGRPPRAVLGGTTTRPHLLPAIALHLGSRSPDLSSGALHKPIVADLAVVAPDADAYQQRLCTATITKAVAEART